MRGSRRGVSAKKAGMMTMANDAIFLDALRVLLAEEGGTADRPHSHDPGGITKLGVTQKTLDGYRRQFPDDEDMAKSVRYLTKAQAQRIYRRMFWEAIKGDQLPPVIASVVFDASVMSGPARAARWLQQALGVGADGWIGPITIEASWTAIDRVKVAADIIRVREEWMRALPHARYNPGWWPRLARLLSHAKTMDASA